MKIESNNKLYDENLLVEVFSALKNIHYFDKNFDFDKISLKELFTEIKILHLTKGPGKHQGRCKHQQFNVKENELFVTLNNIGVLCGEIIMYQFVKINGEYKLKNRICYKMS